MGFWQQGCCSKGVNCSHAHGEDELVAPIERTMFGSTLITDVRCVGCGEPALSRTTEYCQACIDATLRFPKRGPSSWFPRSQPSIRRGPFSSSSYGSEAHWW